MAIDSTRAARHICQHRVYFWNHWLLSRLSSGAPAIQTSHNTARKRCSVAKLTSSLQVFQQVGDWHMKRHLLHGCCHICALRFLQTGARIPTSQGLNQITTHAASFGCEHWDYFISNVNHTQVMCPHSPSCLNSLIWRREESLHPWNELQSSFHEFAVALSQWPARRLGDSWVTEARRCVLPPSSAAVNGAIRGKRRAASISWACPDFSY